MDTYHREIHGEILWKCGCSGTYTVILSVLYAAVCTVMILISFQMEWVYGIPAGAAAFYFLWRIHRLHEPVVLVCEKALLISASDFCDSLIKGCLFRSYFISLEYKEIVGISSSWRKIYLGSRTYGGAAVLFVPLSHLSPSDKEKLLDWIGKFQQS